jgi:hypothetical protein
MIMALANILSYHTPRAVATKGRGCYTPPPQKKIVCEYNAILGNL